MTATTMPGRYGPNTTLPRQHHHIDGAPWAGTGSTPGPGPSSEPGLTSESGGQHFVTRYPGDAHVICEVDLAGPADVDHAVRSAAAAFESWSVTPAAERAAILRRAAALLRQRNDELAELETLDTGKPIAETSVVDIATGVDVLEYYAGVAPSISGAHVDLPPSAFAIVRREPLGVCVGIGAWNYPIQIALWKSAVALACGNTMVFKPAEQTPLTALRLAEIYTEAGLPPGVFNVVQGDASTGRALVDHPLVAKVSITGSVETGKAIMASAAAHLHHVTLELGGKSPIVVFDDASLDDAVNAVLAGNFYSTGQVCSNGTRVFAQRGIADALVERIAERTRTLVVGDPFDPATQLGPLVSAEQLDRVVDYFDDAAASGARAVVEGGRLTGAPFDAGYFVAPGVYADCADDHRFVREEVFGPLMAVLTFDDEREAVQRANATPFGLAAGVFTEDFRRAHRVANALRAGIVWINDYNITPAEVPFGGVKQSGIGRENGLAAIEHYTQPKTIYANLGSVEPTY